METVNNIAAAASKAIWGEPQETVDAANATVVAETKGAEPLSGELGDTNKGEPYDKGNLGACLLPPLYLLAVDIVVFSRVLCTENFIKNEVQVGDVKENDMVK